MSNNPNVPARIFLTELSSDSGKGIMSSLIALCEILENKVDPDPVEIRLVEGLYNIIENLKVMEYNVRSYINEQDIGIKSSEKLASLIESSHGYGSSVLFND